jgi:hypothetical protein
VRDIDTAVVDSPKVLDPNRPIREADMSYAHRMLWNSAQPGVQPVQVPGLEEPSETVIGPIDRATDKCRDVGRSQEAVSSKLAHDNYVVVSDMEGWWIQRTAETRPTRWSRSLLHIHPHIIPRSGMAKLSQVAYVGSCGHRICRKRPFFGDIGLPYVTDERLKSFLDTNQLAREQLCLAILAADKRFSEVRPRHPRGGPDGGRDIEAVFRGGQRTFGAVGFLNQANDSDEQRRQIKSKFDDDLESALAADLKPVVFVFFTNINLTVGQKDELSERARARGLLHCEIFDRERLRITLDSVDGFAIRFQLLGMELSGAEQASFFARWGGEIQSVISTGFQSVERTLERILFLQEASDVLNILTVIHPHRNQTTRPTIPALR